MNVNALYDIDYIDSINCVRWSQNGERLASSSNGGVVKVLDFASEKVVYTEKTIEGGIKSFVIHFIINFIIIRICLLDMFSIDG